jgi:hypothetical protein
VRRASVGRFIVQSIAFAYAAASHIRRPILNVDDPIAQSR